jgi:hypothetical protein
MTYTVGLMLEVDAEDPTDAFHAFVDALLSQGIRNFVYRVTDDDEDTQHYVNGYGDELSIEEVALMAGLEPATPTLTVTTHVEATDDDVADETAEIEWLDDPADDDDEVAEVASEDADTSTEEAEALAVAEELAQQDG